MVPPPNMPMNPPAAAASSADASSRVQPGSAAGRNFASASDFSEVSSFPA